VAGDAPPPRPQFPPLPPSHEGDYGRHQACNLAKAARTVTPAPAGQCVRHSGTCAPIRVRPSIFKAQPDRSVRACVCACAWCVCVCLRVCMCVCAQCTVRRSLPATNRHWPSEPHAGVPRVLPGDLPRVRMKPVPTKGTKMRRAHRERKELRAAGYGPGEWRGAEASVCRIPELAYKHTHKHAYTRQRKSASMHSCTHARTHDSPIRQTVTRYYYLVTNAGPILTRPRTPLRM
jgi:hypothetical protein